MNEQPLVEELRSQGKWRTSGDLEWFPDDIAQEAADRIECLEAALAEVLDWFDAAGESTLEPGFTTMISVRLDRVAAVRAVLNGEAC